MKRLMDWLEEHYAFAFFIAFIVSIAVSGAGLIQSRG